MSPNEFRFSVVPEGCAISAPEMGLTFARSGDRWTHYLGVARYGKIASTVEGNEEQHDLARVVSPVYQDIQEHALDGSACTLLTGQASPHHFSAVVTARREGLCYVIEVDIADRCRAPIEFLAATYVVGLGSSELLDVNERRIVWGGEALGQGRLEFATRGGDQVALAEAGRRALRVQALARQVSSTFTQRLFYSWRWTPPGESRAS